MLYPLSYGRVVRILVLNRGLRELRGSFAALVVPTRRVSCVGVKRSMSSSEGARDRVVYDLGSGDYTKNRAPSAERLSGELSGTDLLPLYRGVETAVSRSRRTSISRRRSDSWRSHNHRLRSWTSSGQLGRLHGFWGCISDVNVSVPKSSGQQLLFVVSLYIETNLYLDHSGRGSRGTLEERTRRREP